MSYHPSQSYHPYPQQDRGGYGTPPVDSTGVVVPVPTSGEVPSYPPPSYQEAQSLVPLVCQTAPQIVVDEGMDRRLAEAAARQQVGPELVAKMRQMAGAEFVFVWDDSGSMKTPIKSAEWDVKTRWDEEKKMAGILVDMACALDPSGVDHYFLNRGTMNNVKTYAEVQSAFRTPPSGATPTVRILRQIMEDKKEVLKAGRQLIIFLGTDGYPTDDWGNINSDELEDWIKDRPKGVYLNIMLFIDDESVVNLYNKWDKGYPRVDVCDDYASELEEVRKARGNGYRFTKGDYAAKALVGSFDPTFDCQDQIIE